MLSAWSHGVGSCIGSIWPDDNERAAKELLGVPRDRWIHQMISFGFPGGRPGARISDASLRATSSPGSGGGPLSETRVMGAVRAGALGRGLQLRQSGGEHADDRERDLAAVAKDRLEFASRDRESTRTSPSHTRPAMRGCAVTTAISPIASPAPRRAITR